MKKALITGITGQDGSYLAPYLYDKGYEVHGLLRRTSNDPTERLNKIFLDKKVKFHYGSLHDLRRVREVIDEIEPDEVYNLAAQSHVGVSFKCPDETWDINYYGVGYVLNEASRVNKDLRFYQASTSEMFGNSSAPQNENTPFDPQSPYGEAKTKAHEDFVVASRVNHGIYAVSGFLFNHESPRRGKQFVTRKITYSFAKIMTGQQEVLELGNLNAVRDWGFAGDYVRAMHLMLQQDIPEDFVIASGEAHTVKNFVDAVAQFHSVNIEWQGEGEHELGINTQNGKVIVKVNPEFYRPNEVNYLLGDPTKAKEKLGWKPEYNFTSLVELMAKSDFDLVKSKI